MVALGALGEGLIGHGLVLPPWVSHNFGSSKAHGDTMSSIGLTNQMCTRVTQPQCRTSGDGSHLERNMGIYLSFISRLEGPLELGAGEHNLHSSEIFGGCAEKHALQENYVSRRALQGLPR